MLEHVSKVLKQLNIVKPECVYCHLSFKNLKLRMSGAGKCVDLLTDFLGDECTLVVPSFPFATNDEYADYLSKEIYYDVESTPARVNLFGEIFRRRSDVHRSLNPILPVSAVGPLADEIVADSHLDEMPFGSSSSFRKMSQHRTYVLGVGVDLNTNSFIHMIDDAFCDLLPFRIYSEHPVTAHLFRGRTLIGVRRYFYITPDLRKRIHPRNFHPLLVNEECYRFVDGDIPFYSLELDSFLRFGHEVADNSFKANTLPPWYQVDEH